jgi:hypothetical protein
MNQPNGIRLDAGDIVWLERELRQVDPVNYPTLFSGILGRRYIPAIDGMDPLKNEYAYKMYEIVGDAKIGAPGANDATVVAVKYTEFVSAIKQIPVTMSWTVRELAQDAKFNGRLQQDTIMAAMSVLARKQDSMLAFGLTGTTIKGLANHASVVETTPSTKTGTGAGTKWIRAVPVNPDEILADIAKMVSDTRTALKQAAMAPGGEQMAMFPRFLLLLDQANYTYISQTPRSSTSDKTILQWALTQNPWLESIEEWHQLDLADTEGNGPRAVLFPARRPDAVGCLIPDEWTALPWQYDGHNVIVPAGGSCGGTVIKYPVAVRYLDEI